MTLIDTLFTWISDANEALWGWCVLWLLVGVSIGLTFLLKGFQFRKWRAMFGVFGRESEAVRRNGQGISSFQAFCVSLGARVGTGNLAGVASAIAVGGPGAVFWMWVMALFGAATAFAEATLAQLYKRRGEGSFFGGPAYYMKYGLKCAPMGVAFAVVLVLNQGMASHIVQSNAICGILGERTGAAAWATAAVLAALALAVFFGGVRRVSRVSAVLVPFMALGFLALAAWVAVTHLGELPRVLGLIVSDAFGLREVAGGGVGVAVMQGVRRGLFSNEAGEGSAPNAAATADVSHPVKQGFVQALGVFADTLVVCTCTTAIILLAETDDFGEGGIVLTSRAMATHVGPFGAWFLMAAVILFAYSTIISNYVYGETGVRFLTRSRTALAGYRMASAAAVLSGGFVTLDQAWSAVDLTMGVMVALNVATLWMLRGDVTRLFRDYMAQRAAGRDPVFDPALLPDRAGSLDGWEKVEANR